MAQGININLASEAMSLEPTALVEFYKIYYGWPDNQEDFLAFSPYRHGQNAYIKWQGFPYLSFPLEASGFSSKGDNTLARPRLKIANIDLSISKYLKVHNNLIGCKVVRKRTFVKFLDDENFEGGNPFQNIDLGQSTADPTAFLPDQTFYVNRRVSETKDFVELELSTALELNNVYLPNRNVYSSYCSWIYRGHGCRFVGEPKTTSNSQPFTSSNGDSITPLTDKGKWDFETNYIKGDFVFLTIDNAIMREDEETDLSGSQNSQLRTYYVCVEDNTQGNLDYPPNSSKWQRDECSKKISDCKLRFGTTLNFGGFPGTHLYPPKG